MFFSSKQVLNNFSIMFDEPSSYLDVKQRLKAAQAIRNLISQEKKIIVVEHDLSILDFLSDYVCLLYGSPGNYGVVTFPSSVSNGLIKNINILSNSFLKDCIIFNHFRN
jgi:ATP-binding cassette subfamily E protein 1